MQYSEIDDFIHGGHETRSFEELEPDDRLAWRVIEFFHDREGFEWWWGDMDTDVRNGIFDALRTLLNVAAR